MAKRTCCSSCGYIATGIRSSCPNCGSSNVIAQDVHIPIAVKPTEIIGRTITNLLCPKKPKE